MSASRPLPVSVIVPVRNGAAQLRRALASVHVAAPAEVIVIDGGSSDGSAQVAQAFAAELGHRSAAGPPAIRVITQRSSGLAAARNEALAVACQPFVAFCDSDDRWHPEGLAALYAALTADPDANAKAHVAIGRVLPEVLDGTDPAQLRDAQRDRIGTALPGFTPGAMLARRAVFERLGGFDETLSIGADSDWFVRLVQSEFDLARLDKVTLYKGMRAHSLSADVARYRKELLVIAARFIARRRGPAT